MAKRQPPKFTWVSNHILPETRGRKKYNEEHLVQRYIKERIAGLHKSHRAGAIALVKYADKHTGGCDTKVNRLRRKFGTGWGKHLNSLNDTH